MAGVFGLRLETDVPPEFKAKDVFTVDMNAAVNPGDWAVVPRVRRGVTLIMRLSGLHNRRA